MLGDYEKWHALHTNGISISQKPVCNSFPGVWIIGRRVVENNGARMGEVCTCDNLTRDFKRWPCKRKHTRNNTPKYLSERKVVTLMIFSSTAEMEVVIMTTTITTSQGWKFTFLHQWSYRAPSATCAKSPTSVSSMIAGGGIRRRGGAGRMRFHHLSYGLLPDSFEANVTWNIFYLWHMGTSR